MEGGALYKLITLCVLGNLYKITKSMYPSKAATFKKANGLSDVFDPNMGIRLGSC